LNENSQEFSESGKQPASWVGRA